MCIICIDFDRKRLTTGEARRALGEMTVKIGEAHAREIAQKLAEAEAAEEQRPAVNEASAAEGDAPP